MKRVAIFASGRGSNAIKIIERANAAKSFEVALIISNRQNAGIIAYAQTHKLDYQYITKSQFYESEELLQILAQKRIDFIALAGFLWLIPMYLIKAYHRKIINIHPALLPQYGGKGMYGHHIHEAVHRDQRIKSGMTIHYVSEKYDEGQIILQASTRITLADNPNRIAEKVLALEHFYFPRVVEAMAARLD
jgi:phosphoribosylglycinamide formyltransferase-1